MTQVIKPPYYIELLTRDKQLKVRHRFEQLPITIGRGYDNDLVVDDPYVSEYHAVVEQTEEGQVSIRDLNSENGLIVNKQQQSNHLFSEELVRLGHSNIRFKHAGSKVSATLSDTTSHQWEGSLPGIIGLLLLLCSTIVSYCLTSIEKISFFTSLSEMSSILLGVLVWAGVWGLITRLSTGGSARLGRHIFIVAFAILLSSLWGGLSTIIAYSFSLEFLVRFGSHIDVFIVAAMIYFHLKTINEQRQKRFFAISALLACLSSVLILISHYNETGSLADKLYMTHILPAEFRLSPDHDVEDFIKRVGTLKPELDKARQEQELND